ncbi:unnamed protein product [Phytophthora fragariaefolia]|uniref:Unnamed protein product n=1 Tax=Phytophthora fragariaefolia TaxID=1490495 RepID=A0A9W6XR69_9STRA|nr:unnamed protein product [Phytophthora fragariaefolia]
MGSPEQAQEPPPQTQTVLRRNKQIAIGRWNSEEHQWFLKGLEMFQGPAWGEIARLIGTRTSTQVRTHAQKFFTKLARLNQTMPYFEGQIQKERARLVAQGASVTPTAQSAPSGSLAATLSPRKRLASASSSPRQSLKRFKDEVAATSPTFAPARFPSTGAAYSQASSQWTAEDGRQWPLASPTSTAASLQLAQLQMDDGGSRPATAAAPAPDAESLPSMNKLLTRAPAAPRPASLLLHGAHAAPRDGQEAAGRAPGAGASRRGDGAGRRGPQPAHAVPRAVAGAHEPEPARDAAGPRGRDVRARRGAPAQPGAADLRAAAAAAAAPAVPAAGAGQGAAAAAAAAVAAACDRRQRRPGAAAEPTDVSGDGVSISGGHGGY